VDLSISWTLGNVLSMAVRREAQWRDMGRRKVAQRRRTGRVSRAAQQGCLVSPLLRRGQQAHETNVGFLLAYIAHLRQRERRYGVPGGCDPRIPVCPCGVECRGCSKTQAVIAFPEFGTIRLAQVLAAERVCCRFPCSSWAQKITHALNSNSTVWARPQP
jgi:hypothetical protein